MLTTKLTLGLRFYFRVCSIFLILLRPLIKSDYLAVAKIDQEKTALEKASPKAKKFMLISACNAILRRRF
jgi:hypothetical protein